MSTLTAGMTVQGTDETYVLDRELGRGGFGVTWKATRSSDQRVVALKQLHVTRGADFKSMELFKREISALRSIDHPQVPGYVDDFLKDGLVLVQTFVEGHDLSKVVRGEVSMDEAGLIGWLVQILEVLVYLHGRTPPVIHRDITPSNIIIQPDGKASLVDFGAVKFGIAGSTASTSTGTFGYAPMEQFVGQAFPASDLYGLGMTAVAVASGKAPVDMTFTRMRVDVRGSTRLDPRLVAVLERMTEPDPERRLSDARVALEQLRPLLTRYGSGQGPALRALAAQGEVTRAIPDDDLLPSERMREAAARLATLESPMNVPPLATQLGGIERAVFSPDGTVMVVDDAVVDVHRMTRIGSLPDGLHPLAVSTAGAVIIARADEHDAHLQTFRRVDDRYEAGAPLRTDVTEVAAISPDGATLATITGFFADTADLLQIFDVESGQRTQRLDGVFEAVAFSVDGTMIAAVDDAEVVHLLRAGGATERFAGSAVAFAPDGITMATVSDGYVRIGSIASRATDGCSVSIGRSVHWPCFSADGRWFAAFDGSADRVVVIDVALGRQILSLDSPGKPGGEVGCPMGLGFSADGERLFAACDVHYSAFVSDDEDCVAVWRVADGAYLGALLKRSEGSAITLVSADGFYGDAGDAAGESRAPDAWCRPEVARRALCGVPVDELIDAQTRAALQDVQTRFSFLRALQADGRLDATARLPRLLDALRGLTHVLDGVVQAARALQAERPSFGGDQVAALMGDQLHAAAEQLARKPKAELDALHAKLVEAAAAREAKALVRVPRSQAAAVRGVSALARPRTMLWATAGAAVMIIALILLKSVFGG